MKKYILIFFVLANNSIFAQINIQNSSNGGVTISPNGILANFPDSKKNDTTNISIGENALLNNPAGSKRHIAIGKNALKSYAYIPNVILDPDFSSQIAIGYGALTRHNPVIDGFNIAIGVKAMGNLTYHDGGNNISIGHLNMQNTNGRGVISIGNASLTSVSNSISSTSESIYIGNHINPLSANGVQNTVLGHYAFRNIGGDKNTILGFEAGYNVGSSSLGHGNVMVGFRAGKNEIGSNKLYIENSDSSNTLIGGDFVTNRVGINRTTAQVSSTNRTFQVEGSALVTETLQLPFGSGTGKILTSDNLGNASWQNIPSNVGNWQTVGTNSARGGFNNNITDGNSNTVLIGETNNSGAGRYMYGMGWGLELQGFGTSAVGMFNIIPTSIPNAFTLADPIFIVGNGQSNEVRSNAMTILKNGNVGIGITNPSKMWQVRKGSSGVTPNGNSQVFLENNTNMYLGFGVPNNRESGILFGRPDKGAESGGIIYTANKSLLFRTLANNTRMSIDSLGNVGIGTTSTLTKKLEVNGDASINAGLQLNSLSGTGTRPLAVDPIGNVIVGSIASSTNTYTKYHNVSAASARKTGATSDANFTYMATACLAYFNGIVKKGEGQIVLPVEFPDNAELATMSIHAVDNLSNGFLEATLYKVPKTGTSTAQAAVKTVDTATLVSSAAVQEFSSSFSETVNNQNFFYYILVDISTSTSNWGNNALALRGINYKYTITY